MFGVEIAPRRVESASSPTAWTWRVRLAAKAPPTLFSGPRGSGPALIREVQGGPDPRFDHFVPTLPRTVNPIDVRESPGAGRRHPATANRCHLEHAHSSLAWLRAREVSPALSSPRNAWPSRSDPARRAVPPPWPPNLFRLTSTSGTRPSLGSGGPEPAPSPCPAPEDAQVCGAADAARWVPSLTPPAPAAHHRGRVGPVGQPPWGSN